MIIALDVRIYKNFNFDNLDRFYNFYVDSYDNLDMKEFLDYVADFNKVEVATYPKIYAMREEQRIKEYEVIMTFLNESNNKNYIIFTDNIVDSYGKIRLFGAIYDLDSSNLFVGNLSSQEEWNAMYKLMDSIFMIK